MEIKPTTPSIKGDPERFTGEVWRDSLTTPHSHAQVNLVRFAPGARTAWHSHANGQTLHVVDGRGRVQVRGEDVVEIVAGDSVYAPPGEWHWHGATDEHFMAHLSITEVLADGQDGPETGWAEHVSDV